MARDQHSHLAVDENPITLLQSEVSDLSLCSDTCSHVTQKAVGNNQDISKSTDVSEKMQNTFRHLTDLFMKKILINSSTFSQNKTK